MILPLSLSFLFLLVSSETTWFSLKVNAVNEERHVEYTKKDSSLEEIQRKEERTEETTPNGVETTEQTRVEGESENENHESDEKNEKIEPKERLIATLDDGGRVGPNIDVHEELVFVEEQPREAVQVSSIDLGALENENMIDLGSIDPEEARLLLSNGSLLEEAEGDRHRDLGSSFVLPVLNSVHYDNSCVPVAFSDIPVHVAVQLNILHLANFNSELMEFSIDVEMKLSWIDLRLVNNYTQPIRIRELPLLEKIWRPDPYIVNSKHSHFHKVSFPNFRMRIFPNGLVTYTMRITSVCNCFMFFCLYPHDRQICDMRLSSIAYPSSLVRLHWHSHPVRFETPLALPELQIRQLSTEECGPIDGKLTRFVVEKYIPSTLAMMFAWVAPYVPYNYEDVRIVTPITVLLTLVQMEKGEHELRTSYLTSMDVWFAAMKCFTVLSLVESLAVLSLIKRSRAMEKSASKAANELERQNYIRGAKRLNWFYHRLDALCRMASPLMFIAWFAYYILFVVQGDEDSCTGR